MRIDKPVLQIALDFLEIKRALKVAEEAVAGGADWLEAGTPLIKSEGLDAVRELRRLFPDRVIVADMKTADAGRIEVEAAAKAGANIVTVLGTSSNSTISECVEAASNYGAEIVADLLEVGDPVRRARELESLGVHYIGVHTPIDLQMRGIYPFDLLREVSKAVSIPVAVAGGINSENVPLALEAGAMIVIVGGAVTKSPDARKATEEIKRAMETGHFIPTELYKRVGFEDVRKILEKVSTANISDAMHRGGAITGLIPITPGAKLVGPAVTVRTYPGDWAKTVQAIDVAEEGDVIVIDAGGVPPAVWGELATHSCIQRRVAGVVIDGAIRDVAEIRRLGFPAFAKMISPAAYEPKGFGEINVPITVCGVKVFPGDWVVGDEDGLVLLPKERVVEIANRAMDVLERENRIREEIERGSTLSKVAELLRWEKKG
jgi:3-hexulose-6-phosphate synthase/6-phospho-3-hexuloisomerase